MRYFIWCFFAFWLSVPTLSLAMEGTPVDPTFGELSFGSPPSETMLCIAGPCSSGQIAISHQHPGQRVAIYKQPVDLTHWGLVEITSPRYSFYQNRLFQVSFRIDCPPELAEHCIEVLIEALRESYGMDLLSEHFIVWSSEETNSQRHYRTTTGREIRIDRDMQEGRWNQPLVSIYDPVMMNAVRLAANPNYRSDAN